MSTKYVYKFNGQEFHTAAQVCRSIRDVLGITIYPTEFYRLYNHPTENPASRLTLNEIHEIRECVEREPAKCAICIECNKPIYIGDAVYSDKCSSDYKEHGTSNLYCSLDCCVKHMNIINKRFLTEEDFDLE